MSITEREVKIAVIGGDTRQIYCAKALSEKGHECSVFGFENANEDIGCCTRCAVVEDALFNAEVVVLPLPITVDGENLYMPLSSKSVSLDKLFANVEKNCVVFAGKCSSDVMNMARKYGTVLFDYNEREEFTVANAYLTAESAIGIAMNELNVSLKGMKVLVIGYGRIGKCLCHLLKALGAEVYASARKRRDFEWIRAYGYSSVDTSVIEDVFSDCKLIFNTVPHAVLDDGKLFLVDKECMIIDLASKPGGVDFDSAKNNGIKVIWALALPGKKLYKSAGRVEAEAILGILEDEVNWL